MALINCPICGKQISDKSDKCVHCGLYFKNEESFHIIHNFCRECLSELSSDAIICDKCGCPVRKKTQIDNSNSADSYIGNSMSKIEKMSTNKYILTIIVAIVLIFILALIVKSVNFDKRIANNNLYYENSTYNAPTNGYNRSDSLSDERIRAVAEKALFDAIRNKQKYTSSPSWVSRINPEQTNYYISMIEEDGDNYRVCGHGYLKDDYGQSCNKYSDGSGGSSISFEVKINSYGAAIFCKVE